MHGDLSELQKVGLELMKVAVLTIIGVSVASCVSYYHVGVDENVPVSGVAVVRLSDYIVVSAIDGKHFAKKKNHVRKGASHVVRLLPGQHSFMLKYHTQDDDERILIRSPYLEGGKKYRIRSVIRRGDGWGINFTIDEIGKWEWLL